MDRNLRAFLFLYIIAFGVSPVMASSGGGAEPEPELDDHGMPVAGSMDMEGEHHEPAPPPFTFFVRGIEPEFIDVVLKAQLAEPEEESHLFPSEFSVRWITPSGRAVQIPLTPVEEENVLAAKIRGPLESGIHHIQATLVMRDEDGFVGRVAEQQAELESQNLRLQAGPMKLFPDKSMLHHDDDHEAESAFSIAGILPFVGLGIFVILAGAGGFLLRKKGVSFGDVLGRAKSVLGPISSKLGPLTQMARPLLLKLNQIAPERLRRVIPSGGDKPEERLDRSDVEADGQGATDISGEATEIGTTDQPAGETADEPTVAATEENEEKSAPEEPKDAEDAKDAEEPEDAEEPVSETAPAEDQADSEASDEGESEPESEPTSDDGVVAESKEESESEKTEIEATEEEPESQEVNDEPPSETPESTEAPEAADETAVEASAESDAEDQVATSDEAPVGKAPPEAEEPKDAEAELSAEGESDAGNVEEEVKGEGEGESEVPSEVDPDQEQTGTVEALDEIVDEAESPEPEASAAGETEGSTDEPATELEIEGLLEPEPSPKDPE